MAHPEGADLTGSPAAAHTANPPSRSLTSGRPSCPNESAAKLDRVALVAEDDDGPIRWPGVGVTVGSLRVEPPLEDVAFDHHRARDLAIGGPQLGGSDVDEQGSLGL